jgi:hypothetical protein
MKKALLAILGCSLISCGSDTESSTRASSDINAAYENLVEAAPEVTVSFGLTKRMTYEKQPESVMFADTLTGLWDNASLTFPDINGGNDQNIEGFVANSLDASLDQSPLERVKMPFLIACCMDILAAKTGDTFTVGADQTLTFTNAVVGVCGEASDFTGMIGETLTYTVTNTTDTTNYDQMIHMDSAENSMFGTEDQWIYIRNNSTTLNLMHAADQSVGEDGSEISVGTISYDKSDQRGIFQFYTKYTASDVKLFRIYFDETANDSNILVYKYNPGGSNEEVAMSLASTFANQTHTAIAIGWDNVGGAYPDPAGSVAGACILNSNSTIVGGSDGTLGCSANSKTAQDISGLIGGGIGADAQAVNGATIRTDAAAGDMDNNLPTFNASTIETAAIGL